MSIDLIGIGNHRLIVNNVNDFIHEIHIRLPHPLKFDKSIDGQWCLMKDHVYPTIEVEWERVGSIKFRYDLTDIDLDLYCGIHAFYIRSGISWEAFLRNKILQDIIRENFYLISRSLFGSRMIYVPDSGGCHTSGFHDRIEDGMSLDSIEYLMLQTCGKPSSTIGEILSMKSGACFFDGYFIDNFGSH